MTTSTKKRENLPAAHDGHGLQTREDSPQETAGEARRGPFFAVIGLCLLGLANMIYLTYLHWSVKSDPDFSSFCAISAEIDCDAVAASPYSMLFGVPVSFWGVLAYLALIAVAVLGLRAVGKTTLHRGAGLGLLSGAVAGALAVSATLGYISVRFIESICIMCILGYVINLGIAVAVALNLRSLRRGPHRVLRDDLAFILGRPVAALSMGAGGLILAASTIFFYPAPVPVTGESAVGFKGDPETHAIAFWEGAPSMGPADAPVTIVEFTDYQCPFCRRTYADKKDLLAPYEGRYRLIHRHYPLDGRCNSAIPRHGNGQSCNAAKYAICAGEQGRFWELNSLLFTTENRFSTAMIRDLAEQAGCDMEALDGCLESERPDRLLARDTEDGAKLDIAGTPTFFINGERVLGIPSPELLESVFGSVQ